MKKRLYIATALMTVMMTNAQEVCSFDAEKLGITSDGIELKSGTVVGETQSVVCSLGADDIYYVNANAAVTITATVNDNIISGGFIGSTNPKDADGGVPSKTLKEPVMGSFLVFEAKSDGFLYVPIKASSNKAFTVFEDGTAVSFTYAAIGNELTDLGSFYQFTLPFTVKNGQNVVQDPIEWAEQEYLKATAPAKYAARWYEDAQGNKLWNSMKVVSAGVIKFPVRKDSKYIVNANGAKTNAGGFYFDTTGDADVIVDNTKILGVGVGPQIKQNIVFADNAVKALCVANWDTDGDGELSIDEATAVKDLGMVFKDNVTITSFNELLYFTGLTSIASDAFTFCSNLSSLIIPNGVTSIDSKAFYYCSSLTSIIIPNNVTSINDGAFKGCRSLSIVTIPKNVAFIGYNPFEDCSSLANIQVESGNTIYDSRENCNAIIETSSNTLVSGCINTTIPDGIITIAEGAFSLCNGLTSISLPNSVTTIGDNAFYYCTALSSISIPKSVTSIYHNPFSFCGGLTSITVESGNNLFDSRDGCNAIIEKESNKLVLGCKNTIIPNSVSSIGDFAFSGCTGLTSMNIPVGVTSIGQNAFLECSGLTSVTIPNSVTDIGDGAFDGCDGLITIISKINNPFEISDETFPNYDVELIVPAGTKSAYLSTAGWNKFTNITEAPSTKRTINVEEAGTLPALIGDDKYQIEELTLAGELNGTDFKFIREMAGDAVSYMDTPDEAEVYHDPTEGMLRSLDISNAIIVEGGDPYNYITYGTDVTFLRTADNKITAGLFDRTNLKSILLPSNVTSIEGKEYFGYKMASMYIGAFPECLTSLEIPVTVESIGNYAFYGCTGLTEVIVNRSAPITMEECSFPTHASVILYVPNGSKATFEAADYWKEFKQIKEFVKDNEVTYTIEDNNTITATAVNDPKEKDVVIPESVMIDGEPHIVTAISDEAFKDNTSLTLVCIPETIEEIGEEAFAGCNSLMAIYCYSDDPIALGNAKATVRTRNSGDISALTVFTEVDMSNCILYVPMNCGDKYRNAKGWSDFQNIVEMKSNMLGDANNDANVDSKDIDATVNYIMEGKTEDFIFKNADTNADKKVNVVDIVKFNNLFGK